MIVAGVEAELAAHHAKLGFGLIRFELGLLLFGFERGQRVDVGLGLRRQVGDAAAHLIGGQRRLRRLHALLRLGQLLIQEADGGLSLLRDQVAFAVDEDARIRVRDLRREWPDRSRRL
jgi:hypothetical protein